jgi:hypothetical protein
MRLRPLLSVAAVALAFAMPGAASAEDACVGVWAAGTVNLRPAPVCVATPFQTACGYTSVGVPLPPQTVAVTWCLP